MSRPSRLLNQDEVRIQTDQELARSYCELQQLRRQVRIAECGMRTSDSGFRFRRSINQDIDDHNDFGVA
jgi:hypothetical protein